MRQPNYDKYPSTKISGAIWQGWNCILDRLAEVFGSSSVWAVDLYAGTLEEEIVQAFRRVGRKVVLTRDLMRSEEDIVRMTRRFMTDDVLFGYISNVRLEEYFDGEKVRALKESLRKEHLIIIEIGRAHV